MKELMVKRMYPEAKLPTRGTEESAGLDLYAYLNAPLTIPPGEWVSVSVGVSIALEVGKVGLIFSRSGMGVKSGISLSNSVGVIDSDYRGELLVSLMNHSQEDYVVYPNDRIGQLVVMPIYLPVPVECQKLPESQRGAKGFGSTGR